MKQKRHTTEEIIRILREVDNGQAVDSVCREHNILRNYGAMQRITARLTFLP